MRIPRQRQLAAKLSTLALTLTKIQQYGKEIFAQQVVRARSRESSILMDSARSWIIWLK